MDCELRNLSIDDDADSQQRAHFMVSGTLRIAHSADPETLSHWQLGIGLTLQTRNIAGSVVFSAPFSLGDKGFEDLVLRTSVDTPTPVSVHWTDDRCEKFSSVCQTIWSVPAGKDVESRISFFERKAGTLRELRFSLPPAQSLAIHRARAAPNHSSDFQTLIGVSKAPVELAVHQAQVDWSPHGGLRITIPQNAQDAHFSWKTDLVAADAGTLIVETHGRANGSIDIFFESSLCRSKRSGHFSSACRLRVDRPRDSNVWVVATGQHPRWRGRISRIRIDFDGMNGTSFELVAVRAKGTAVLAGLARDGAGSPPLLRRFEIGGPLGWELAAGQSLDCTVPNRGEHSPLLPDFLEFNVPADSAPLQILELRASWIDVNGGREPAGLRQEQASRPSDSGWIRFPLRAPTRWPKALNLELVCARNCNALDERGRTVQVARPLLRWPTDPYRAHPLNLILIVIDTLRADRLSLYGYEKSTAPFLLRWSEHATVYDRVIAVGTRTIPTHAALFTGHYPLEAGRHHFGGLRNGTRTLASILAHEGYATFALTDAPIVSSEYGFDIGFDRFEAVYEPARNKFERFVEEIALHAERGEPYFGFLHTYAVHEPYSVSPEERARTGLREVDEPRLPIPSSPLPDISLRVRTIPNGALGGAYLSAEYDVGIAALDAELEFLLEALSARDLLSNTLVAITSDHGEEFLDHGRLGHGIQFPHREIAWVPLIVKEPEQRTGNRIQQPLSQAEIPNLLLFRLGSDSSLESTCVVPGHPAAFVSTRHYSDHPIESHFPVAVYLEDCHYYEISERSTESIIESGFLGEDPEACRRAEASLRDVVRCMKNEQRTRGHYGASSANSTSAEPVEVLDNTTRIQLEALGYVK